MTLVVVLDRPSSLSKQSESNVLTVIPDGEVRLRGDDLDYLAPVEGKKDVTVEAEEPVSLVSLPSGNNGPYEDELILPESEREILDPTIKGVCEALVEELKRFGKNYWIFEYRESVVRFQPDGTQIIDEELEVLVRSGHFQLNYLRCLVWFGLGAKKNRNALSLSFGDYLIIRSEEHPYLIAIARLDWNFLERLDFSLRDRRRRKVEYFRE